ncbi:Cyanophycin synthase [Alkalibacterium sp. AK22]|uniref:ATP-binding protein n=1 Tax=Alkalibacterium sp. AK22 TaxID=1229520 RepID=UPI0004513108|nr:hypothetical protein [Alkalibacterium sp. AK22]EXJ23761.1 Cyanophycin synthase [Alkalibacterium sp. AK22]
MQEEKSRQGSAIELDRNLTDYEKREGLKSRLLEEEALRRGYSVTRLSFDTTLVTMGGKELLFKDMNGPLSSASLNTVVDDKQLTRSFLKEAKLTVPASTYLPISQTEQFVGFAESFGYPVVLKPNNLARGQGVFMNLSDEQELRQSLEKIEAIVGDRSTPILIEKHFTGEDFRFVIVDSEVIAVSKRARANVVGDGKQTILELIQHKNSLRAKDRDLRNFPIPTDPSQLSRLSKNGLTMASVPEENQKVILRDESNIASGGEGIDFTYTVSEGFKQMAIRAVNAIPGLNYAGVDMIAEDITAEPTSENHVVTEVEFSPGPVSMFPWEGEPIDMAGPVLAFYERNVDRIDL